MKKFVLAILSFVYITIASGVVVNVHYCMGRLSGVDYTYNSNDKCGKCGMDSKKGCCHNEFKIVKLADDQQLAKSGIQLAGTPALVTHFFAGHAQPVQGVSVILARFYHSPPGDGDLPVYLSNCVFRI